jgi:hypothetical protein
VVKGKRAYPGSGKERTPVATGPSSRTIRVMNTRAGPSPDCRRNRYPLSSADGVLQHNPSTPAGRLQRFSMLKPSPRPSAPFPDSADKRRRCEFQKSAGSKTGPFTNSNAARSIFVTDGHSSRSGDPFIGPTSKGNKWRTPGLGACLRRPGIRRGSERVNRPQKPLSTYGSGFPRIVTLFQER